MSGFKLSISLPPLRRANSSTEVALRTGEDVLAEALSSPGTPALPRRSSLDVTWGLLRPVSAPALLLAGAPPRAVLSSSGAALDVLASELNGLWKKDWSQSEDMVRPRLVGRGGLPCLSAPTHAARAHPARPPQEPLAAAMKLPWMIRKATRLVSDLKVRCPSHSTLSLQFPAQL